MGHTRMYLTALTALLIPAGAGVATVYASPTCEKFVKTYVSTPVRNRVSKTTAEAWAKWRVGHPNWKPNPHVKRPRYKMSQHEVLKKVDFACQVETEPKMLDAMFPPDALIPPTPEKTETPIETADVTVPDTIPPLTPDVPPSFQSSETSDGLLPPYIPPVYTSLIPPVVPPTLHVIVPDVPVAPAPEPSTLALLALGTGSGMLRVWRSRRATS